MSLNRDEWRESADVNRDDGLYHSWIESRPQLTRKIANATSLTNTSLQQWNTSFDFNQSFPRRAQPLRYQRKARMINDITGNESNSVSFGRRVSIGSVSGALNASVANLEFIRKFSSPPNISSHTTCSSNTDNSNNNTSSPSKPTSCAQPQPHNDNNIISTTTSPKTTTTTTAPPPPTTTTTTKSARPAPIRPQWSTANDTNTSPLSMSTADAYFWANVTANNCSFLQQVHAPQTKQMNKAVLTLDYKTSRILIANDMVCQVFGVDSDQLIGRQLTDMISSGSQTSASPPLEPPTILDHSLLLADDRSRLLPVYGKVMELLNSQSHVVPVSVWSYPIANVATHQSTSKCPQPVISTDLDHENHTQTSADCRRWLIVLEPVERITATCTLGPKGRIFSADERLPEIFGFLNVPEMLGTSISRLLPTVKLGKHIRRETNLWTCGVTKSHGAFPLNVIIDVDAEDLELDEEPLKYDLSITVYQNVSGVITVLENGSVHSYNPNFVNTLLGYKSDQLRCHPITDIMPKFYRDMERNMDEDDDEEELPLPLSDEQANTVNSLAGLSLSDMTTPPRIVTKSSLPTTDFENDRNQKKIAAINGTDDLSPPRKIEHSFSVGNDSNPSDTVESPSPLRHRNLNNIHSVDEVPSVCMFTFATSTPSQASKPRHGVINEGTYTGYARHRDGCLIAVWYQVKKIVLKDDTVLYSVWIHRDHSWCQQQQVSHDVTTDNSSNSTSFNPIKKYPRHPAIGSTSTSSSRHSTESSPSINLDAHLPQPNMPPVLNSAPALQSAHIINKTASSVESKTSSSCLHQVISAQAIQGDYSLKYRNLVQIGKGAFGAVGLSSRNTDGLLVITKFIRKDKVLVDSWECNADGKRVPIEISLLRAVKHNNIVSVLEICENDRFYQLMMEKHGPGMDLFEFIDRRPIMDEALASYIFRQVVSAVSYLDSLSIVHRDLKDENVIIDENFQCKLIDFGSAAYFGPNKYFRTFCGTVEYCSPEVLSGNKYCGPELEIWSLGILLYTLMFGENPFCTVEETIRAELEFPSHIHISESCENVINWMLHPNVAYRVSIHDLQQHWWLTQKVKIDNYCWPQVVPDLKAYEIHPPKYLTDLSEKERELLISAAQSHFS